MICTKLQKTKVEKSFLVFFCLFFFAISVFWCMTWILLNLLIFWPCLTGLLLCVFLLWEIQRLFWYLRMFFVPLHVTQFQDTVSANVNFQNRKKDAAAVLYPEFVRYKNNHNFRKQQWYECRQAHKTYCSIIIKDTGSGSW